MSVSRTRSAAVALPTNWSGIISRELERFMSVAVEHEDEDEAKRLLGRTHSQVNPKESTSAAGGATLVPRLPRRQRDEEGLAGRSTSARAVAEPWDLKAGVLQKAAFESLLLALMTDAAADKNEVYDTTTAVVRVQMNVSRRQCQHYEAYLGLPAASKDVDVAAVHLAKLQNVELQPFLHYRFLLLQARRAADFGSAQEFNDWYDRQSRVFLSGLFWSLENLAARDPGFAMVRLANLQVMSIRDAYYEISSVITDLKEIVAQEMVDSEVFVEVAKGLELDIEALYEGLDRGCQTSLATTHALPLPYPLSMELYTTTLLTIFDQENWGELLSYADEIVVVLDFWRPVLNVSERMHRIALMRCHFIVYLQCLQPAALATLGLALKATRQDADRQPTEDESRSEGRLVLYWDIGLRPRNMFKDLSLNTGATTDPTWQVRHGRAGGHAAATGGPTVGLPPEPGH
jgi:hypothetical protein